MFGPPTALVVAKVVKSVGKRAWIHADAIDKGVV